MTVRGPVRTTISLCATSLMIAAVMLLAMPLRAHAQAGINEALSQASGSAQVVVVIPSLAKLSQDIALFKQAAGLPINEMDDALGSLKRETGMVNGINDQGSLLVVLQGVDEAIRTESDPTVVLLLPVSDYAAFLGNFNAQPTESVVSLTMPDGQAGFAKQLGSHAVMSDSRQAVEAYQPAGDAAAILNKIGAAGRRYAAQAHAAVYIDLESLAPALLPKLDEEMRSMTEDLAAMGEFQADGAADPMQAQQAMMQAYIDGAKAVLNSSVAALAALELEDQGLGLTQTLSYKPDSVLAKVFIGGQSQARQELTRLPDQPFILAGAVDTNALAIGYVVESLLAALPKQEQDNPVLKLYLQSLPMLQQTRGVASAWYAPTDAGMMGGSLFKALTLYRVDDPAQYLQVNKQYLTSLNEQLIQAAPGADPAQTAPAMSFTTTYTENALQIDGVSVDQYSVQMNLPMEAMPQEMPPPMQMLMTSMSSYSGYIAAQGDHVIMTMSTDPLLVKEAIKTVKEPSGVGAAGAISQIRQQALPPNAAVEMYVSLQGIAQAANLFLVAFTGGQPIDVPADVPPMVMGLGIETQSVAGRVYVPTRTIRFITDQVQHFQNQMMQQMGPEMGPQGAPPPPYY